MAAASGESSLSPSEKANTSKTEKWSNDQIFRLIDEYEARSCLWDVFSDDYHNRDITSKAKKEMEVSLQAYLSFPEEYWHWYCAVDQDDLSKESIWEQS